MATWRIKRYSVPQDPTFKPIKVSDKGCGVPIDNEVLAPLGKNLKELESSPVLGVTTKKKIGIFRRAINGVREYIKYRKEKKEYDKARRKDKSGIHKS
jgi:hypothetical protein